MLGRDGDMGKSSIKSRIWDHRLLQDCPGKYKHANTNSNTNTHTNANYNYNYKYKTAGRFGVHLVREISPWSSQVLCIGLVKT